MAFALARWDPKAKSVAKPASIAPPGRYEDLIVLARPKLSFTASQPNIWIRRRNQFEIAWEVETWETPEDQEARLMREIVTKIKAELDRGRKHTPRSLEDDDVLTDLEGATQKQCRRLINLAIDQGYLHNENLPKDEQQGRRKTYLSVVSIPQSPDTTTGTLPDRHIATQ